MPDNATLTLSQHALLTQNIITGYFMYAGEEKIRLLWKDVKAYETKLSSLGIKDSNLKYEFTSEDVSQRIHTLLQRNASRVIATTVVGIPLSIIGEVLHSPILLLAYAA